MKRLLVLALVCLAIVSCTKEDDDDDNGNNGNSNNCYSGYITSCQDSISINMNINYSNVTDIDGNDYRTVTIGNQEWMAENLKTTKYSNGDNINCILSDYDWGEVAFSYPKKDAYSWYTENDSLSFKNCLGGYYNWYAVSDQRNLCPTGWSVPNKSDFEELINSLGSQSEAGNFLKSTQGWFNQDNGSNGNGSDIYGFRATPNGMREVGAGNGEWYGIGKNTRFWTISEEIEPFTNFQSIIVLYLSYNYGFASLDYINSANFNIHKAEGINVRCIKD